MKIDREQFRKTFPHLAREMESRESSTTTKSSSAENEKGEGNASQRFDGYSPDIIDFLCRCENERQAEEIIEYLQRREEISQENVDQLKKQLREKGVRSFGPKKEDQYYLKKAGF